MKSPCLFALALALALTAAADARAAGDEGAEAEALFREAKKLMDEGNFAAACPKLAESQRLDPGNGTLARLAACHEKEGKLASAWSEFAELVTSAQRAGQADREKFARQHVAALQPQLSRLTLRVPPEVAAVSGLTVRRDGAVVGPAVWGVAVPLDPGEHALEATAPGHLPWSAHFTVGAVADSQEITVLALEAVAATSAPAPVAIAVAPPPAPPRDSSSTRRTAGAAIGVVGLVGLGVGGYFGIAALSGARRANETCPTAACSDPGAVHENDLARTNARVADVVLPLGLAGTVAGALLVFWPAPAGPRIQPVVGSTTGVRVEGSF
jgi:serine/threonine-protein kinase